MKKTLIHASSVALIGLSGLASATPESTATDESKKTVVETPDAKKDSPPSAEEKKASKEDIKALKQEKKAMFEKMAQEFLKKNDTDGDGKLSDEERKVANKAVQAQQAQAKAEMLKKYDADADGKLSPDERKIAKAAVKKAYLEKFDADGNGKLEGEERKKSDAWKMESNPQNFMRHLTEKKLTAKQIKSAKYHEERMKKILEKFDADGDGKLNEEEELAHEEATEKRKQKMLELMEEALKKQIEQE